MKGRRGETGVNTSGRGFGLITARERRQADRFYLDLLGIAAPPRVLGPGPRWAPPPATARAGMGAGGSEPGRIFDRIVHGGANPGQVVFDRAPNEVWEVVAFPGSATPQTSLQHGDLAITRARGEARLAHLRILGEAAEADGLYDDDGLVRGDTLVLRRRPEAAADVGAPDPGGGDAWFDDTPSNEAADAEDIDFASEQDPVGTTSLGEATVGTVRVPISVTAATDEVRPSVEEALKLALGRNGRSFAVRGPLYGTGEARLCAFTPPAGLPTPAPMVIDCAAGVADLCALVFATGTDVAVYFAAQRATSVGAAPPRRWVLIPSMRDY